MSVIRGGSIRRIPIVIALVAIVVGAAPAWGAPPSKADQKAAVAAFNLQAHLLADGRAGDAYKLIVPEQQKLFTAAKYEQCTAKNSGIEIKKVEIKHVGAEAIQVPGTLKTRPSLAVTAKLTLTSGLLTQSGTDTYHEFRIGKQWRFSVKDPQQIIDGVC